MVLRTLPTAPLNGTDLMTDLQAKFTAVFNAIPLVPTSISNSSNDYTIVIDPVLTAGLVNGMCFYIKPNVSATGAVRIRVTSSGTYYNLLNTDGAAIGSGSFNASTVYTVIYYNGSFVTTTNTDVLAIIAGTSATKIANSAHLPPVAGTALAISILGALAETRTATTYLSTEQYLTSTYSRLVLVPGVIRCTFNHWIANAAASSYARVLKNGTQVTEWSTTSTSAQARSVDVTVACGDVIDFQHRTTNGTYASSIRDIKVQSGNINFMVA